MWVLHLGGSNGSTAAFRWEEVTVAGTPPAPRFDHTAVLLATLPNSPQPDKLLVLGGRDSMQHFTDVHVLDLDSMSWQQAHGVPALSCEVGMSAASNINVQGQ